MGVQDRRMVLDATVLVAVALIGMFVVVARFIGVHTWVVTSAVVLLMVLAVYALWRRLAMQPDHLRAMQSMRILGIANESLAYLRQGLTTSTAQDVCALILRETGETIAVAITDRETVLGFAGRGEDHHRPGRPILTRATHEVVETGEHRILSSKEEIGCPQPGCVLGAAIVVPLEVRRVPVGTLKFYYRAPDLVDETQIAMVEGLGRLLSTQLELAELEHQREMATRMELKALQSQINPHFLFNTINTIASLIRTDPPHARELLREFAAFYRHTLESGESLIALETEIEYVRRYLVFERARFGEGRVRLTEDVAADVMAVEVPAFILQPLVENAVQHGIRPDRPLHIRVAARRAGDGDVRIDVVDDGCGIPAHVLPRVFDPGFGRGLGIALKNVDDRLKGHFGAGSGLFIDSREGEGTTVTVRIRAAAAEGEEDGPT